MPMQITSHRKRKPSLRSLLSASSSRLYDHPWALQQRVLESLAASVFKFQDDEDEPCDPDDPDCPDFPVTRDGVAALPISGVLLKSRYAYSYPFATSYAGIMQMCDSAMRRSDVKSLLLCCDSPGGDTSDLFPTAEYVRSLRGSGKPIAAISNDNCYSACYAIAASADQLFVMRTGGVGSIGVWVAHLDTSGALAQAGLRVTLIKSGARKTEGNPYEPLSDSARADLQKQCNYLRSLFVQHVAESRACSTSALLSTEAAAYTAGEGCPMLADAVVNDLSEPMDYLTARTKRLYAGGPGDKESPFNVESPQALHRGSQRQLSSGGFRSLAAPSGASGYSARDLARIEASAGITRRYPGAVAASRLSRRAASVSGRSIIMLPCPYSNGNDSNYADIPAQGGAPACRERYRPGAFAGGLDGDILCFYAQHRTGDDSKLLGRKSAGNLRVWEDAAGVHAVCEAPNTSAGDDCLELLRAKILKGCSAGFWVVSATYTTGADGKYTRWIEQAFLHDVSLEPEQAYQSATAEIDGQTSSGAFDMKTATGRLQARIDLLKLKLKSCNSWEESSIRRQMIDLMRERVS
jgi:HK97 family phage prohead protease